MILFANYRTVLVTDKNGKKKGTGGERVLYTTHMPAWDAKNRIGLPDVMSFDFQTFAPYYNAATGITETTAPQPVAQSAPQPAPADPFEQAVPATEQADPFEQPIETGEEFEFPTSVPASVTDLAVRSQITIDDLMQIIYKGGFMPIDTPVENVPADLWEHIAANWDKALGVIGK